MAQPSDVSNLHSNIPASAGGEDGNNESDPSPGLPAYRFSPDPDSHHAPSALSENGNQSTNLGSQSTAVSHASVIENLPIDAEVVDAAAALLSMARYRTLAPAEQDQGSQPETLGGSTLVGTGRSAVQGPERTPDSLENEDVEMTSSPDTIPRAASEPTAPATHTLVFAGYNAPPSLSQSQPPSGPLAAAQTRNQYSAAAFPGAPNRLMTALNSGIVPGSVPAITPNFGGGIIGNLRSSGQDFNSVGNNTAVSESSGASSHTTDAGRVGNMITTFQITAAESAKPPQTGTPKAPIASPITPVFTPNIGIKPAPLPDADALATEHADPNGTLARRLATYQSFSAAGDFIEQNVHPIDKDLLAPPIHHTYVIKTMSTIKCDECGDKLSRGGELYQCKTCSAQICQTCVDERLRVEENFYDAKLKIGQDGDHDAGNQEAQANVSLLSHETDPTRETNKMDPNDGELIDYRFVWQSRRKHMPFRLVYLDRKANKDRNRGPWDGVFALDDYASVPKTVHVRLIADAPRGARAAGIADGVVAGSSKLKLRVSEAPQAAERGGSFLDAPRKIRTVSKEERAERKRKARGEWKSRGTEEQIGRGNLKGTTELQDSVFSSRPETLKKLKNIQASAGLDRPIPPRLLTAPVVGTRFEDGEAAGPGLVGPHVHQAQPLQDHDTTTESRNEHLQGHGQGLDRTTYHQEVGQPQVHQAASDQGAPYEHAPHELFLSHHHHSNHNARVNTHINPQGAPTITYPAYEVNYIYPNSFSGESGNPNVPLPGRRLFGDAGGYLQGNVNAQGLPQLRKYLPLLSHVGASYGHPGVYIGEIHHLILGSSRSFVAQGATEYGIPVSFDHPQMYVNLVMADPRFNSAIIAAERTRAGLAQNPQGVVQADEDNNILQSDAMPAEDQTETREARAPTEPIVIDSDSDDDHPIKRGPMNVVRRAPGRAREVAGARRFRRSRSPVRNEPDTRVRFNRADQPSIPPHIRATQMNFVPQTTPIRPIASGVWQAMIMRTQRIRLNERRAGRPLPSIYERAPLIVDPFAYALATLGQNTTAAPPINNHTYYQGVRAQATGNPLASAPADQNRFAYPGTNPRPRPNEDPLFVTLPIRPLFLAGMPAINYFPDDDGVRESHQLMGAVAVPELELYSPLTTAGMAVRYAFVAPSEPLRLAGPEFQGPVGRLNFGGVASGFRPVSFGGADAVAPVPVPARAGSSVSGPVVPATPVVGGEDGGGKAKGREKAVEEENEGEMDEKEEGEVERDTSLSPGPTRGLGLVPGRLRSGKEFQ